jgi:hypothetical protein
MQKQDNGKNQPSIGMHNDGKEKWQSFTASLIGENHGLELLAYGADQEEALEALKVKCNTFRRMLEAIELQCEQGIYIKVDCAGKPLEQKSKTKLSLSGTQYEDLLFNIADSGSEFFSDDEKLAVYKYVRSKLDDLGEGYDSGIAELKGALFSKRNFGFLPESQAGFSSLGASHYAELIVDVTECGRDFLSDDEMIAVYKYLHSKLNDLRDGDDD